MYRRGISAIMAMVMIVLITIALVVILWSIIIPLINAQLHLAEECRRASTSLRLDSACTTVDNITFTLSRKSDEINLIDVQFGAKDGRDSIAVYYISQLGYGPERIPGPNEKRYYTHNITLALTKVLLELDVAAVVKYKNREKTCDPIHWVEVPWCGPNKTLLEFHFPKSAP